MESKRFLLLDAVLACTACAAHLPDRPRPILQVDARARLLIAGQAPGRRAHASGVPFDDASGDRLRTWLGVDRETFHDAARIAILPMGFCYPGTARGGDLAPRPECAPLWRERLLAELPAIETTLLLGRHAIEWHLPGRAGAPLGETVAAWRDFFPAVLPMPHPSPRNQAWLKRHPWFERDLLPALRVRVAELLNRSE